MVDLAEILTDLNEESRRLDDLVASLTEEGWRKATPADGWTISHQISHLAWTDHVALLAATDADAFAEELAKAAADPGGFCDTAAVAGLAPPGELLPRWRRGRADLAAALARTPAGTKLPWFMTSMTPASMATGRLMETWAHGEDIAAAVGEVRLPTNRLRHIAYLGVKTMTHGFLIHGRPAPGVPVYVELRAPDGATWAYGPPDADNKLIGPAADFCQLVTQRRHPDDLALEATGPVATEWLSVAQTFAGPPGGKRPPSGKAVP